MMEYMCARYEERFKIDEKNINYEYIEVTTGDWECTKITKFSLKVINKVAEYINNNICISIYKFLRYTI